jgi:hypothetical protein
MSEGLELIKQKYIEALILTSPSWQWEFHVHTNASLLAMGVMLFQNVTRMNDQPIVYASRLIYNKRCHCMPTDFTRF